jgi:hypothetical protein
MSKPGVELRKPWLLNLRAARERCKNKRHINYFLYGGRGITCDLTRQQAELLWNRDRAYEMDTPTLDRIDRNGNYTFLNCRFLEMRENARRARLGWRKKAVGPSPPRRTGKRRKR